MIKEFNVLKDLNSKYFLNIVTLFFHLEAHDADRFILTLSLDSFLLIKKISFTN